VNGANVKDGLNLLELKHFGDTVLGCESRPDLFLEE
jgi:hypothetical protein